jgi:pyoverdine/dityrosine biosynthesis protein Dit1
MEKFMDNFESLDLELAQFVRLNSQTNADYIDDVAWTSRADVTDVTQQAPLPLLEERIVEPQNSGSSDTERIWGVLSNKRFRQGTYENLARHGQALLDQLGPVISRQEEIHIVLPTIPFKDQSAITTGQRPDAIDLGEHAMIAQFRDLLISIRNVYPPGARLHLVGDGLVYRSMCENISDDQIANYGTRVAETAAIYGLAGQVDITDFSDIISQDEGFLEEQLLMQNVLRRQLEAGNPYMTQLQRGMLANMWVEGMDMQSTVRAQSVSAESWSENLRENTGRVACQYASFILTAARRNTLARRFPGSVRATVHPKDSPQIPLHIVNRRSRLLPYNGVPVIDEGDATLRSSLRIVRLATVLSTGNNYLRYGDNAGDTLYYEQASDRGSELGGLAHR